MITGLRVADAAQQGVAADGLAARLRLALAPAAERRYVDMERPFKFKSRVQLTL